MHLPESKLIPPALLLGLFVSLTCPGGLAAQNGLEQVGSVMKYRCIGPFRGGRSAAVTGVNGNPMLYYMGAAGGGLWKTEDAGSNWENVSDGFFGGSIGAVAVAPSDSNVIYVGGGECTVRGNVSHGYGMWKSLDAGKTWNSIGLEDSRRIPRIAVHPRDSNLVYAAVLGHLYGPSQERGVFRSRDGGKNWEKVLFVNDDVGAFDLTLDPGNPRVLYATTWNIRRTPYSLESGGKGCGLWKSTDGGDSWEEISRHPGLPTGTLGVIGVTVSPVDSNRVWVIVEAADGGVFRSDDAGGTFRRVNEDRNLRQRAWYYTRIYAGPDNIDEVYVVNVSFWHSRDGGKNFSSIRTPHGDHHDLWIDPVNPRRMVIADDGGAQVTFNQGKTWSTYMNQPTSQFYRVTTDDHYPYRVYGAQQDNSTVRISSRGSRGAITERDWEPTAGGESGHLAIDPRNNDIVYGGSYGGLLTRRDHRSGQVRNIHVWPDNPMGSGAGANKYRFQWNFPIFFSPHDPGKLYTAAQCLFVTENEGQSWTRISGDLTRNDPSRLGSSGGPITKDNTCVEYYCTIFAALESPHEPGVLWTGSDDGLIQLSRNSGKTWTNVTPAGLPEWSQINSLEAHPTEKGGLYVAATRYKLDDFKPYLYRTLDYGKTWTRITDGIDRKHFTRVIRADPGRKGLLYAGTESGIYASLDDGKNWTPFQMNLPVVPVTDLAVKNDDLVVATQGRSFWILDDLTLLHQLDEKELKKDISLFRPRSVVKTRAGRGRASLQDGQNPDGGVRVAFLLRDMPDKETVVKLSFATSGGSPVQTYSTQPDREKKEQPLVVKKGMNEFLWNMRYPDAETFEGMVLWAGGTRGPAAIPGSYTVTLEVGSESFSSEFEILKDPRSPATDSDFQSQLAFLLRLRDKLSATHLAIRKIRTTRKQINTLTGRLRKQMEKNEKLKAGYQPVLKAAQELVKSMTEIEEKLYQTKNRSPQDPLNFPIRLNNKLSALAGVVSTGDYPPTQQAEQVYREISARIDVELNRLQGLLSKDLKNLNLLIQKQKVPAIFPE
ncbi:MAG: glycosyl hydrolase [Planctomycetota bacterium]|nr:glycosyl hydrolase [Planctomycetota bacterium]